MVVTVDEAQGDLRGPGGEVLQDRSLAHTVSAPRARDAQQVHLPCKSRQHEALRLGEVDLVVDSLPPLLMLRRAVPLQVSRVKESRRVRLSPVHEVLLISASSSAVCHYPANSS